jgi:hypothetical protein
MSGCPIEQASGNGWYRAVMAEAYLPAGWPEAVAPPGAKDWERSAVEFPVKFICSADPAAATFLGRPRVTPP